MSSHCIIIPCPLLLTLGLSGSVNMEHLWKVLRVWSGAGCELRKIHLLMEDALKLGVQDCVDELEFSNEDAEPRGMVGVLGKNRVGLL